jgi:hypothetical protein
MKKKTGKVKRQGERRCGCFLGGGTEEAKGDALNASNRTKSLY